MYTHNTYCRACDYGKPTGPPGIKSAPTGENLAEVFDLGLQPLANDFCSDGQERSGFAPLKVLFCPKCSLAQLSVTVRPDILYSKYSYVTSKSNMMQGHFKSLWDSIRQQSPVESVIEIGSNDGDFLMHAGTNGAAHVCGIDPAQNLSEIARKRGIQTLTGLFDADVASTAKGCVPTVNVIVARHVFCHISDWVGFVNALDLVCNRDTLVVIEVPYVMDLLSQVQFDTIYHEHLSYMNIKAMVALLKNTPFRLDHIQHFPIHSGSIGLFIRRRDWEGGEPDPHQAVELYLENEDRNLNPQAWKDFAWKARLNIHQLKSTVSELAGKSICGFGASAKSTVWVNACGFTRKDLKFITDSTPQKQWKFSPGSDIPIVDSGALIRDIPDYAVLFCWNYESECIANNALWIEKGGKFIVPVPEIHIVP